MKRASTLYLYLWICITLTLPHTTHATFSTTPSKATARPTKQTLFEKNKFSQKTTFQNIIDLGSKALLLGSITYGLYYLATILVKQPTTSSPTRQKPQKGDSTFNSAPANFSHSGPICYRNSLLQVLCHADCLAPAILEELNKANQKEKIVQEFTNLMTSNDKIKDWEKYPNLHQNLFKDVGENEDAHTAKDPVHLFTYWATIENHPMAFILNPFTYQTEFSAQKTKNKNLVTLLVAKDLTPVGNHAKNLHSAPKILCMYADGDTTGIKPSKTHPITVKEKDITYELVGFLGHIASPSHYIAYIRRNNQWYRCDDIGTIKKIDNPFDTKGIWNHKENRPEEPHMLFYAKQETI